MFDKLIRNSKLNLQTLFTLSTVINLARMSTSSCSIDQQPSYSLSYVTIDTDENASKLAR